MQPQSGGQMKHEEPMGNGQWPTAKSNWNGNEFTARGGLSS